VPTPTDELLKSRARTHGRFEDHAMATQQIKNIFKLFPNWGSLSPVQKEAMEMVAHKLGRILAGDPNEPDHWDDIAGYARLVSLDLAQQDPDPH
jgi:hypothetical protein